MINERTIRSIAEEIAPKISSIMELPIDLRNLEYAVNPLQDRIGAYNPETNILTLNSGYRENGKPFFSGQQLYHTIAHELCHYAQSSNFPQLTEENNTLFDDSNGDSMTLFRTLIEGDAEFSSRSFERFPINIDQSCRRLRAVIFYNNDSGGIYDDDEIDVGDWRFPDRELQEYGIGYYAIKKVYAEKGRKGVNELYKLALAEKIEYINQFIISVPEYKIKLAGFLLNRLCAEGTKSNEVCRIIYLIDSIIL